MESTTFWINNPLILIQKDKIFELWPLSYMSTDDKLNAITRIIILLSILGYIILKNINILASGIVSIIVIVILYLVNKNSKTKIFNKPEPFTNIDLYQEVKHNFTNPDVKNPMMNVMLTEINDNPDRLPAAPSYNKSVEKQINDTTQQFIKNNFQDKDTADSLFNNLGEKFGFKQSMRQFYSTPNTRVENNQSAFAKFCYGNMASCKDGDIEQCIKNNPRHINI
jgi:hypothetical protein